MLCTSRIKWFGHVQRSSGWITEVSNLNVVACKRHGKPKRSWWMTERSLEWSQLTLRTAPSVVVSDLVGIPEDRFSYDADNMYLYSLTFLSMFKRLFLS